MLSVFISKRHFDRWNISARTTKEINDKKNISWSTVDIRHLEYLLSRTFTMSNYLFDPFSILINFPYKSARYLELRYLEFSLCRTIFSVPSAIFGPFPIRYLEHSNGVFEWIILFISCIRMLITALTKLCSEFCYFFISTLFR